VCEDPILLVERAADLAADNAADHCTGDGRRRPSRAAPDLVAEDAAGDSTDNEAGILLAWTVGPTSGEHGRNEKNRHGAIEPHGSPPVSRLPAQSLIRAEVSPGPQPVTPSGATCSQAV
jgi:hypothetical protein